MKLLQKAKNIPIAWKGTLPFIILAVSPEVPRSCWRPMLSLQYPYPIRNRMHCRCRCIPVVNSVLILDYSPRSSRLTDLIFQIRLAYSLIVRSLENFPMLATFRIAILDHSAWLR